MSSLGSPPPALISGASRLLRYNKDGNGGRSSSVARMPVCGVGSDISSDSMPTYRGSFLQDTDDDADRSDHRKIPSVSPTKLYKFVASADDNLIEHTEASDDYVSAECTANGSKKRKAPITFQEDSSSGSEGLVTEEDEEESEVAEEDEEDIEQTPVPVHRYPRRRLRKRIIESSLDSFNAEETDEEPQDRSSSEKNADDSSQEALFNCSVTREKEKKTRHRNFAHSSKKYSAHEEDESDLASRIVMKGKEHATSEQVEEWRHDVRGQMKDEFTRHVATITYVACTPAKKLPIWTSTCTPFFVAIGSIGLRPFQFVVPNGSDDICLVPLKIVEDNNFEIPQLRNMPLHLAVTR
jgi:hypothetical protein